MTTSLLLGAAAGVVGGNAVPHFVKGMTKEPFPTPFGPSPVINLVAGWSMLVLAGGALAVASSDHRPVHVAVGAAGGVLAIGLFHSTVGAFGRTS